MSRFVIGVVLLFHGLIYASFLQKEPAYKPGAPRWPFHLDRSWLLSSMGIGSGATKAIGSVLVVVVVAGFLATGAGLVLHQSWWRPLAVTSAAIGLVQLLLFFHPWFVVGVAINIAILVGIAAMGWPSREFVGS